MLFILSLLLAYSSDAAIFTNPPQSSDPQAWQQEMLREVNKLRATGCQCGSEYMSATEPLKWNDLLQQAAQIHADDMATNTFFDHEGSDKSTLGQRIKRVGYRWVTAAENIGLGHSSVAEVVKGWKDSPGHCKNMMAPRFNELGAAHVDDIWVQVLGRQINF